MDKLLFNPVNGFIVFKVEDVVYLLSPFGELFRETDKKPIKWHKRSSTERRRGGYVYTRINNKTIYQHRVIAKALIPNPQNKPCVNHRDGDASNNCVDNLEWSTYSENNQHAYDAGLKNHEKPVEVTHVPTGNKYQFKSVRQALNYTKQQPSTAHRFLSGKFKTPKTYNYKYL